MKQAFILQQWMNDVTFPVDLRQDVPCPAPTSTGKGVAFPGKKYTQLKVC